MKKKIIHQRQLQSQDQRQQPAFTDESTPTPATSPVAAPSSAAAPKTTEKDIVLVHTNDVHGCIVEEKGRDKNTSVVGDAKLATVIENERAKKDQTTVVLDAGDASKDYPFLTLQKGKNVQKS